MISVMRTHLKMHTAVLAFSVAVGWFGMYGAATAQELESVSVRMDWVISPYHAPFFVGIKNGFYEEEGLDVTVEPGNGSANVAMAIGNHSDDFGTVDGGTMMQLVSRGLPVKAVMGWFQRNPIGVIYNVESGIQEPKDLEGKTVAITHGDAPSLLFPAFTEATGVDTDAVNMINVDAASKNASVISGRADATITFSFLGVPIIEAAGIEVDTLDYFDFGVNVPGLAVITHTEYLERNPNTVEKFTRATRRAIEWTVENPEEAIEILVELNPHQRIVTETAMPILLASFDLLHTDNTTGKPIGVMAREDWEQAEEILVQYLGLDKVESPDRYFTNELVGQ